ncbi:hypothetical protein L1887_34706 [Cichorium endivia]|nr:hypothetical protein L1887_34706 [Cichorium endivia]
MVYRENTSEKHSSFSINGCFPNDRDVEQQITDLRRACLVEKWMDKDNDVCEKVVVRRRAAAYLQMSSLKNGCDSLYFNSSSSSSDSSYGGGFYSSEAGSINGVSSRSKPICTYTNRKLKNEGKFMRTKSRAMKICGDLKKVKQPISPGGR